MKNHIKKYGKVTVPKGTILYRKGNLKNLYNCIDFSLVDYSSNSFDEENQLQYWKTKKDFELLFMIKEVDSLSNPYSSINEIFINHISKENNQINDLDIKLDLDKRDKVISFLQTENILGWFSSIEDSKSELEICLFPKDFISINEYVEQLDNVPSKCLNALTFLKIEPSEEFFIKSKNNFVKDKSDFYKYHGMIDFWINEYLKEGKTNEEASNELITLRTLLKI